MDIIFPEKKIVPFIDAYLSVMLTHKNIYNYVISENFIRCFYFEENWVDYYKSYDCSQYDVFRTFELTSDFMKLNNVDISVIINNCLNDGYFVLYSVDTYYISNYISYNEKHIIHPLLIYGKDNLSNNYKCRDYFDFTFYSQQLVNPNEITNSFIKCYIESNNYYNNLLVGFQLNQKNVNSFEGDKCRNSYKINLKKILYLLNEYIQGENFFKKDINNNNDKKVSTGINMIAEIKDNLIQTKNENRKISLKPFKFLEHHIYMMKERINILDNIYKIDKNKSLYKEVCNILKQAEECSNLSIKYDIKENNNIIFKIIKKLDFIDSEYKTLILKLIKILESN